MAARQRMARQGDRGVWKSASGLLVRRWRLARLLRRSHAGMGGTPILCSNGAVVHARAGLIDRRGLRIPSDLTDTVWALLARLIPPARRGGRKRTVDVREVVNAIVYALATAASRKRGGVSRSSRKSSPTPDIRGQKWRKPSPRRADGGSRSSTVLCSIVIEPSLQ